MIRIILAAIAAAAISGCTAQEVPPAQGEAATTEWNAVQASARRSFASLQAQPFADGSISVVAPDGSEIRTFRLVPCGPYVCAWSAQGPRGQLERTLDHWVVRGLYNREFWLSPGGDGVLRRPGRPDAQLAWGGVAPPPMGGR